MRSFAWTAFFIFLAVGSSSGQATPPVVDLGYARYQGVINPTTQNAEFLGVRYAAPPTGNLRWREPQAPRRESQLQLVNAQPNRCHETGLGTNPQNPIKDIGVTSQNLSANTAALKRRQAEDPTLPPTSEDCLFLNVYTPGSTISRKKLPVVFWIHGGGYTFGAASGLGSGFGDAFDGNDLIRQAGGKVVVVVIQYRLGLFGFLSSSQVKRHGVLNAGLLDQDFALKWVQSHISKFGGDPSKVTIWGQSAGAGSVLQHLIANGGNTRPPLFRGAMLSSSFLPSQYPFNHRVPESYFNRTLSLTGCSGTQNPIQCLRNADASSLASANAEITNDAFIGTAPFVPVVDGSFIKENPIRAIQKGKFNTKHVLAVTNSHEGDIFVNIQSPGTTTIQQYINLLFPFLTQGETDVAASFYGGLGSITEQANAVMGEAIFVCPTYALLNGLNGSGFNGEFAIPPALHGSDVQYFFPSTSPTPPSFNNQQFINAFSQSFLDFVLEQNPNVKRDPSSILPHWPRWRSSSPVEAIFNRTGDLPDISTRMSSSQLRERCNFWANTERTFQ